MEELVWYIPPEGLWLEREQPRAVDYFGGPAREVRSVESLSNGTNAAPFSRHILIVLTPKSNRSQVQ